MNAESTTKRTHKKTYLPVKPLTGCLLQLDEEQLALKAFYSFILQNLMPSHGVGQTGWLQVNDAVSAA